MGALTPFHVEREAFRMGVLEEMEGAGNVPAAGLFGIIREAIEAGLGINRKTVSERYKLGRKFAREEALSDGEEELVGTFWR